MPKMLVAATPLLVFHVAVSLLGIVTGLIVLYGFLVSKRFDIWTAIFLATTVLTSATGFLFKFEKFLPSHGLAVLSLILLAIAIYARYARRLAGVWRPTYVITAVAALYFNVFVLVVQAFLKVPALKAMAPNQTEPPFLLSQLVVLIAFIIVGIYATKRFHPTPIGQI
jgi:hypothetical protein